MLKTILCYIYIVSNLFNIRHFLNRVIVSELEIKVWDVDQAAQ